MLPFADGALDAVFGVLSLHWVNDLPGTLAQIRRALRPDGLLLAAMLGGDTLVELRDALIEAESEVTGGVTPRVSPFADLRDAEIGQAPCSERVCQYESLAVIADSLQKKKKK